MQTQRNSFKSRNLRILICETNAVLKNALVEVLRNTGYKLISVVPSAKEALHLLEVDGESIDWFISSLNLGDKVTALHLLQIFQSHPELNHIVTSLLLGDDEREIIPVAFDMGAFSWHPTPFTKESIQTEMQVLHENLVRTDFNLTLTAAEFLRRHLREKQLWNQLKELEQGVVVRYPEDVNSYLSQGQSLIMAGEVPEGLTALARGRLLDPSVKPRIDQMIASFGIDFETIDPRSYTPAKAMGINRCLIIDPDGMNQKLLWSVLLSMGIPKVDITEDGQEAWEAIQAGISPDLIILEWRLPKLAGFQFLQRIRMKGFVNVPVFVMSNQVEPNDLPLLKEFGVNSIIRKPVAKEQLAKLVVGAIREESFPSTGRRQIKKIADYLASGDLPRAKILAKKFLARNDTAEADKLYINAEFAFYDRDFETCRSCCMEALKKNGDGLVILNLLGKAFLGLNDFVSAHRCFSKAQSFSPANIERLCLIAESQIGTNEFDAAATTLEEAKKLDDKNSRISEGAVKLALTQGNLASAKDLIQSVEQFASIVAFMNNRGVSLAKVGKLKSAVELFEQAAETLPKERIRERCILLYNLGLNLAKADKYQRAMGALQRVLQEPETSVHKKAASLLKRLKQAIKDGTRLQLNAGDGPKEQIDDTKPAAMAIKTPDLKHLEAALDQGTGGHLCQGLCKPTQENVTQAQKFLANPPRFTKREAIKRERSMGLEKLWKSS